jgi:hypothetical protein
MTINFTSTHCPLFKCKNIASPAIVDWFSFCQQLLAGVNPFALPDILSIMFTGRFVLAT